MISAKSGGRNGDVGSGWRIALLYGDAIFARRHCSRLVYPSRRENVTDRGQRRPEMLCEPLGWEAGFWGGEGWKPKGMRWDTFERSSAQHDAFVQISLAGMAAELNLLREALDALM